MVPAELTTHLAEGVDLSGAGEVIELRTGLRSGYGQTFLVQLPAGWVTASRESVLDPYEVVPLAEEFPVVVERGAWDEGLLLRTAEGEQLRLNISILDRDKLHRVEELVPQPPPGLFTPEEEPPEEEPPEEEPVEIEASAPEPSATLDGDLAELPADEEGRDTNPQGFSAHYDPPDAAASPTPPPSFDSRPTPVPATPPPLPADARVDLSVSEAPRFYEPRQMPEPPPPPPPRAPRTGPSIEDDGSRAARAMKESLEEQVVAMLGAGNLVGAVQVYGETMGAGPVLARMAVDQIAAAHGISTEKKSSIGSIVVTGIGITIGLFAMCAMCNG